MNPVPLLLIIVTLPLLLGGCGEKATVEPVAEVKPKLEGVNLEELEEIESIWYLKDSETPYTGKVYSLHPNGQKEEEGNLKDGKIEGLVTSWRKNGQKWKEEKYKDGKKDGPATAWHENGQKWSKETFKDGKRDGLTTVWHSNGQMLAEAKWKDGKQIYIKFWNSKGESVNSFEEADKSYNP